MCSLACRVVSRRPLILVCAVVAVACVTVGIADSSAAGTVVVVNSTGDGAWDGTPGVCETATGNSVCTLRAAIGLADAGSGMVIGFNIAGAGVHTIAPGSPLPDVTAPMTIDGSTQPGYAGSPLVELSGASAGVSHGLVLGGSSSGSTIRGLDIVNWSASGIVIFNNGNTVAGNFIGIDPTGSTTAGNGTQGVLVDGGSRNTIGGTTASDRNVLSGNGDHGIQIQRPSPTDSTPAQDNVVEGNYVGTNAAGDAVVANALDGISLVWGAQGNTIGGSVPGARNIVSGNGRVGISVFDTSTSNAVEGNYIGTNAAGTAALGGNPSCGIQLNSASNVVGGDSRSAGNVISGNAGCAIADAAQPGQTGASGSDVIEGNYIGTNAAGTTAIGGNGPQAIVVLSSSNTIGSAAPGTGNVISGNAGVGLWIAGPDATANVVQGNSIGTDSTTTRAIGNSGDGVLVGAGAQRNTIGGTAPADGNTIAHNTSNGVEINGGTGDPIEANSIFANSGLGIALTSGGNGDEPAPRVLSALSSGSSTTISGTAATGRRVEVFANPNCSDPEGAVLLSSTASSSGNWSLTVPAVAIGNGITATATNLLSDNTSQFSACQATKLGPPVMTSITPRTFSSTGAEQTYTVPAGVHSLFITAIGASGGGPMSCCLAAGRAAEVSGIVHVKPGQVLYVEVGGRGTGPAGGFNGGGDSPTRNGLSVFGGGGASDVRTLPMAAGVVSLSSRLIVAAGGGGSGYPAAAGGDAGAAGSSSPGSSVGGRAGAQTAGGAGGCDALHTGCGMDGSFGNGGTGGSSGDGAQTREGAGGGGGLYGGGGGGGVLDGAVGGGGGGSSLVPSDLGRMSLVTLTTAAVVEVSLPSLARAGHARRSTSGAKIRVTCTAPSVGPKTACKVMVTMSVTEILLAKQHVTITSADLKRSRAKRKVVIVGRARVVVRAGHARIINIPLNRKGKRLLAARSKLPVSIVVTQTEGDTNTLVSRQRLVVQAGSAKRDKAQ